MQPAACLEAGDDDARRANRVRARFEELLAERHVDMEFGRSLPRRLRQLGLVDVGAGAWMPIAVPGAAELEIANVEQVRAALPRPGAATSDELDAHVAAARSGRLKCRVTTPPLVSAWGRRSVGSRAP